MKFSSKAKKEEAMIRFMYQNLQTRLQVGDLIAYQCLGKRMTFTRGGVALYVQEGAFRIEDHHYVGWIPDKRVFEGICELVCAACGHIVMSTEPPTGMDWACVIVANPA